MTYNEERPWGNYEIICEYPGYKIKKITVYPNKRLSYQFHFHREEFWHVVSGIGLVTLNGDGHIIDDKNRNFFYVDKTEAHRIHNISNKDNLVFIEIQSGNVLDEHDIVRLEDDYGRE